MFGMQKEEIDLRSVLEIKLAKHDQITSGPPFRLLATQGDDDKRCWNWKWSRIRGSSMMLPKSLLGPVLFHFSISLSYQGIHVSLVKHRSVVLLQIQMTTMSWMHFWRQIDIQ